jgi:DNA-binding NarL/FixJ family response regulator
MGPKREAGNPIRAIKSVARGESWLTPPVPTQLMTQMRRPASDALSERELEVLLVAKGHSNQDVATEMHIGQATVKKHLIHVFCKLEVNDRTAAVTAALERGIVSI